MVYNEIKSEIQDICISLADIVNVDEQDYTHQPTDAAIISRLKYNVIVITALIECINKL